MIKKYSVTDSIFQLKKKYYFFLEEFKKMFIYYIYIKKNFKIQYWNNENNQQSNQIALYKPKLPNGMIENIIGFL